LPTLLVASPILRGGGHGCLLVQSVQLETAGLTLSSIHFPLNLCRSDRLRSVWPSHPMDSEPSNRSNQSNRSSRSQVRVCN
jgi:hypothetical protein